VWKIPLTPLKLHQINDLSFLVYNIKKFCFCPARSLQTFFKKG